MYITTHSSPIGTLTMASNGTALTGLWLAGQKYFGSTLTPNASLFPHLPIFEETRHWLDVYFSGSVPPHLPPLAPEGSPFRQAVWQLLSEIPHGRTTTYGAIAARLRRNGVSAAAQAVGGAVGHNPILILIPCHRVLGSNGSLTGYAGGIDVKRLLLELEGYKL